MRWNGAHEGAEALALSLLLAAALVAPPLLFADSFAGFVFGITMIYILWASGMNLLYGYAGLMPLTYAGVAGISAYGTVNLVMSAGWSFWTAMPLSVLVAAGVGVLLGLPSLRLQGFYFTLSSLVIQAVLTLGFVSFSRFTNGDTGINQIPPPLIPFTSEPLAGRGFELALAGLAWLGVVGVRTIVRSDLGQQLIALREDPVLAEALGIDVTRCKLLAFFIGSLYAGVGGAFYAAFLQFVSPRSFDLLASLNIWLMVAFGGRGSLAGPILGALVLAPVPFLLQRFHSLKDVIYGVLVIAVTVLMPAGLYGALRQRFVPRRAQPGTANRGAT